jgi:hypothetical protein
VRRSHFTCDSTAHCTVCMCNQHHAALVFICTPLFGRLCDVSLPVSSQMQDLEQSSPVVQCAPFLGALKRAPAHSFGVAHAYVFGAIVMTVLLAEMLLKWSSWVLDDSTKLQLLTPATSSHFMYG